MQVAYLPSFIRRNQQQQSQQQQQQKSQQLNNINKSTELPTKLTHRTHLQSQIINKNNLVNIKIDTISIKLCNKIKTMT